MHITITELAKQAIQKQLKPQINSLKLVFNSEGCGCAVNGIPQLWLVPKTEHSDQELETESPPFQIKLDKQHEVFFEELMTLDYRADNRTFQLKSNNQIYNAAMSLVDKTEGA